MTKSLKSNMAKIALAGLLLLPVGLVALARPLCAKVEDDLQRATSLYEGRKYREALKVYNQAIGDKGGQKKKEKKDSKSKKKKKKKKPAAKKKCKIEDKKLAARAYFGRSKALFKLMRTREGLEDLNRAVQLDGKNPEIRRFRGSVYIKTGEFQKASRELSFALKNMNLDGKDQERYNIILERSMAYRMIGLDKDGIRDLTTALSIKDEPSTHLIRADQLYKMRKYEDAATDYGEALKENPDAYRLLLRRGYCYELVGKTDEAIENYSRILETRPTNSRALYRRSQMFIRKGDLQKALEDVSKAIFHFRGYSAKNLYKLRAGIYKKMGNMKLAAKDYAKAKRMK